MHAVVINVSFDDQSAAQASLDALVPRLSATPGFVSGYWVALSDHKGASIAVFDSEDQAKALEAQAQSAPAGPVKIESIEVGEVVAHA